MSPHRRGQAIVPFFAPHPAGADSARLLAIIEAAAFDAAGYIRGRAGERDQLSWVIKSHADFVSDVDTGAEFRIHSVITEQLSELRQLGELRAEVPVRFLAEESALADAAASAEGITFVVDPLDGTTNFLHGYPWYAVSIAALVHGVVVAAVVHNVPTGESFTATAGGGAFQSGVPIGVSEVDEPARALIGTGLPFKHLDHIAPYLRALPRILRETAGVRRAGSASLDLDIPRRALGSPGPCGSGRAMPPSKPCRVARNRRLGRGPWDITP